MELAQWSEDKFCLFQNHFMRKALLFTTAFLSFAIARSQVNQGSVLVGGNIGFGSGKIEGPSYSSSYSSNQVILNPSLGFAIRQNTILGFGINYGHSKIEGGFDRTTNLFGGSIFLRKYLPLGKSFNAFGETLAYFDKSEDEEISGSSTFNSKSTVAELSFHPGISYSLTNKFQLEVGINSLAEISYTRRENTNTPNSQSNQTTRFFSLTTAS
jgi:hypothetical protein